AAKSAPSQPAPRASAQPGPRPENARKGTMSGLVAIAAKAAEPEPAAPAPAAESSFFPETDSKKDLPPPEDRTVMKQAAELLEDALREAGGSMDEIGDTAAEPARPATPAKPASTPAANSPLSKADEEETVSLKKNVASKPPANRRVEPAKKAASSPPSAARPSARPSTRPSRAPSALQQSAAEEGGGGGKAIWLILAAVLVGGGVYAFTKQQ